MKNSLFSCLKPPHKQLFAVNKCTDNSHLIFWKTLQQNFCSENSGQFSPPRLRAPWSFHSIRAETHCAFLHSALSLWPTFALPSHVKAVCTAASKVFYGHETPKEDNTTADCGVNYIINYLQKCYWSSPMGKKSWHTMLSLQAAPKVSQSYATQLSERQLWRTSFDVNML